MTRIRSREEIQDHSESPMKNTNSAQSQLPSRNRIALRRFIRCLVAAVLLDRKDTVQFKLKTATAGWPFYLALGQLTETSSPG